MISGEDNLSVLRRLRSEGRISDDEFRELSGGSNRASASDTETGPGGDTVPNGEAAGEDEPLLGPLWPPVLREDRSPSYIAGVAILSILVLACAAAGVVPWLVAIPVVPLLVTTLLERWWVVTVAGTVATGLLLLLFVAFSAGPPAPPETVTVTLPSEDPYPPIPGSLGIYVDQITELWNFVDAPPAIDRPVGLQDEAGRYDTFLYPFGDWARLAGAYEPGSEAIYALYVTGAFSGAATDQLYLHVCHLVAPYSPECIESYQNQGLAGGTLADYDGLSHEAEWTLHDQTWRLEIEGNVLTIRVFGPDA